MTRVPQSPDHLDRLYAFTSALVAAERFDAAAHLFERELQFFGITGYACGEVDLDKPERTVMVHAEWPEDWLSYYSGERLQESDPLIEQLRLASSPFGWDETWNALSSSRWRQAVLSFGWRSGLAVPLARGNGRVGLISLTSMHAPLSKEENALLTTMSGLFYERARGLGAGREQPMQQALTPREIACLELVASGLDDTAIGMRLGIAASTAHEHVERAKRKLNARTRAQAVALAVAGCLFSP